MQNNSNDDWMTEELMKFVRHANTHDDARYNIKPILREYKQRMTKKELIKLFFN